jgi:uncharacterized protein YqjF (DUF2071 family)
MSTTETMSANEKIFLSAEWRDLLLLNYVVDPRLLVGHIPAGTVVDSFEGKTYVSVVGFRFCNTKIFGSLPIPFHQNFDEINLRFYVRPKNKDPERRGVVFIAEIVPRWAVAATARLIYGENYRSFSMKHSLVSQNSRLLLEYGWKMRKQWCSLQATADGASDFPEKGSVEEFITEHYWGYSSTRSGGCIEYHVQHPQWKVRQCISSKFEGDASAMYGEELAKILIQAPDSAFVADGSPIIVYQGKKIM